MFKRVRSRIGTKLLVTISIIIICSMVSLSYVSIRSVRRFGEFSADTSESSIKTTTFAFLSRLTEEQAARHEAVFQRISDSSSMLAEWAGFLIDNRTLFEKKAFDPKAEFALYPPNGIYSNRASHKTMVLYWGSPTISREISQQLTALSFIDPLLIEARKSIPESTGCFIVTKSSICRYYPNIHSVTRLAPPTEYDMRSSTYYVSSGPEKNPERKTMWTHIYQDPSGQGLMTTAGAPIYTNAGEFFGIAGISVTLDSILNEILGRKGLFEEKPEANTFSFLIDLKGVIIAMPLEYLEILGIEVDKRKLINASMVIESNMLSSHNAEVRKLGRSIISKDHQTTRIALDGRLYLVSSHIMPSTKWHFGFVMPESVVLASVKKTRQEMDKTVGRMTTRFIIVTILFLLGSLLVVAGFLIRNIIRPLGALSQAASRVRDGDLTTKLEIGRKDEIGALAVSFDSMVENLRKGKELEKEHTLTLEKKVEERTSEIRQKTEELEGTLRLLKQEISEREYAEIALRESERRFRSLGENAPDIIYTLAPDGTFTYVNPVWEEILGHKKEEVLRRRFTDFLEGNKSEKYIEDFRRVMDRKETIRDRTVTLRHKNGSSRLFSMSGAPNFDAKGEVNGIVGLFKDITELRKLEAQLLQAQKMETMGTLTSGVAHNFRNILAQILLNSELIQMVYEDYPKLKRISDSIKRSVDRGSGLVDGLMHFSRRSPMDRFEALNLSEVIQETYQIISRSFDKSVAIRLDVPRLMPVLGNHSALSQVFMNLCTNARDAMPGGGELHLEARKEDGSALIIVSDTGHGMDKEIVEKCFDPFFTTKEVGKGTGLGLYTTYGIVKDHGGEIHVYSEPGKGTTFKLYLPLVTVEKPYKPSVEHEVMKGKGEKILFVDDEVEIHEPIKALLEQLDYRVLAVSSGKEAIDEYKSWKPDLVLLDRNMPEMDGTTCAKRIIEHDRAARIVLVSGYDEVGPSGIDGETAALVKGYVIKPIILKDLNKILSRIFSA